MDYVLGFANCTCIGKEVFQECLLVIKETKSNIKSRLSCHILKVLRMNSNLLNMNVPPNPTILLRWVIEGCNPRDFIIVLIYKVMSRGKNHCLVIKVVVVSNLLVVTNLLETRNVVDSTNWLDHFFLSYNIADSFKNLSGSIFQSRLYQ